jgi:hypothetical protein
VLTPGRWPEHRPPPDVQATGRRRPACLRKPTIFGGLAARPIQETSSQPETERASKGKGPIEIQAAISYQPTGSSNSGSACSTAHHPAPPCLYMRHRHPIHHRPRRPPTSTLASSTRSAASLAVAVAAAAAAPSSSFIVWISMFSLKEKRFFCVSWSVLDVFVFVSFSVPMCELVFDRSKVGETVAFERTGWQRIALVPSRFRCGRRESRHRLWISVCSVLSFAHHVP